MGWGGFFDKLMDKLPIQGRRERWLNEIENLSKEKKKLTSEVCDEKKSLRLDYIDDRLEYLNQLVRNAA